MSNGLMGLKPGFRAVEVDVESGELKIANHTTRGNVMFFCASDHDGNCFFIFHTDHLKQAVELIGAQGGPAAKALGDRIAASVGPGGYAPQQ